MTLDMVVTGSDNSTPLVTEPFTFDYSKVPDKYRIGNGQDRLVLFRGDVRELHRGGILSKAYQDEDIEGILEAKRIIESGDEEEIFKLIDRHTDGLRRSPLISTSYNPQQGQVYAPTMPTTTRKNTTIYRIELVSERAIIDADDTGKTGNSGEILVLGLIYPNEITAVKLRNDDRSSELYEGKGGCVRLFPDRESRNRDVKDPKNWLGL